MQHRWCIVLDLYMGFRGCNTIALASVVGEWGVEGEEREINKRKKKVLTSDPKHSYLSLHGHDSHF